VTEIMTAQHHTASSTASAQQHDIQPPAMNSSMSMVQFMKQKLEKAQYMADQMPEPCTLNQDEQNRTESQLAAG